jgi:uncharacterized delta-60 repeat protein
VATQTLRSHRLSFAQFSLALGRSADDSLTATMSSFPIGKKHYSFAAGLLGSILILLCLVMPGQSVSRIASLLQFAGSHMSVVKVAREAPRQESLNTASQPQWQRDGEEQPQSSLAAGDLDTSFDPGIGVTVSGTVYAVAIQSDGKIVLGGSFSSYNGVSCNGLARINNDGSLDTSFNLGAGANGTVNALAIQSDGKILLGGTFSSYNGVSRNRIARVNSDGGLDPSFDPGAGVNNTVYALAIQNDGKILVGGSFQSLNRIARFNSDGSLDTSFHTTINNTVYAVAIQNDGKIVLGGSFTSFSGTGRTYAARVNSDGSLDTAFNPGIGSTAGGAVYALAIQTDGKIVLGGLFSSHSLPFMLARVNSDGSLDSSFSLTFAMNVVYALALQGDGKILVGGAFTINYGGGVTRNGIMRINSNGSLDSSFDPGTGINNVGQALAIQSDGRILLAGGFTNYNGVSRDGIARVNSDGSLDTALNPGGGAGTVGTVSAVALQTDGRIVLAGSFTAYNNVPRNGIARVNGDGSLDTSFNPGAGAGNGGVYALAIQTDGKIVLAGGFTSYNNVSRSGIVRVNSDGSLDTSFNPGTGANNSVLALAIQSDGKILIGGAFSAYNGVGRNGIARANSDGSLDTSFNPGTGADANPNVGAVAIQSDGKILLAGGFSIYNGVSRSGIARVNNNGTLDTSFDPGTGAPSNSSALRIQTDGKILLAGEFSSYNGVSRNGIARVNSDGSLDTSFDPGTGATIVGTIAGVVDALAIQSDGRIVIAGSFLNYNGTGRRDIARINSDGSLDTSFNPGTGVSNIVYALAIQIDRRIVLGGFFSSYNGVSRSGIARILGGASMLQFSASNYMVGEGEGHVTITVTRTGDTSGSASVDYKTVDDPAPVRCDVINHTAYARCDYATTLDTLTFAPGDTSKTFAIPIIDDSYAEGDETFQVALSNPSIGVTLGAPATATVTIIDNDAVNGPNPILLTSSAGVSFFVRQHYLDFLAREPEPGEPWSAILNGCANQFNTDPSSPSAGCDRLTVSGSFFGSPEFLSKGVYTIVFYRVAFTRLPDYLEFAPDLRSVTGTTAAETNAKRAAFANNFVLRTEFVNAYGGMTNSTYVTTLMGHYSLSSITTPDPANPDGGTKVTLTTNDLINGLNASTLTRAQVLRAIVQSDQVSLNFEAVNAFVASQYYGYLRRTPDTGGFNSWVAYLNAHPSDFRTMVNGFMNSIEYRLRFGP